MTTVVPLSQIRAPLRSRRAVQLTLVALTVVLAASTPAAIYFWQTRSAASLALLAALLASAAASGAGLWLAQRGRSSEGAGLALGGLTVLGPVVSTLIADLGLALGVFLLAAAGVTAALTMRRPAARVAILSGILAGVLTIAIDLFLAVWLPWSRLTLPEALRTVYVPSAALLVLAAFTVFVARGFANYRLNTKLLIGFVTVALVPLALLTVRNDQENRAALRTAAYQSLLAAAARTAATVDAFLNANLNAVTAEARLITLSDYLALPERQRAGSDLERQAKNLLASLQSMNLQNVAAESETRVIQAYLLLDTRGNIALSTTPALPANTSFLRGDLFMLPRMTGRVYGSPVYFTGPEQGSLYFSAPVLDLEERVVGVLVTQVNTAWLQRIIVQSNNLLGADSASFAALFDENGLRLADGAAEGTNVPRFAALPSAERLTSLAEAGQLPGLPPEDLNAGLPTLAQQVWQAQSQQTTLYVAGVVHYAANPSRPEPQHLAALLPLSTRPWVVMFAQPESVALAPAEAQTRVSIFLSIVFALGVAAVSVLAARNLAMPINDLTTTAERVRAGDLGARAQPLASDEIGLLSQTFNTMTAQLQEMLSSLEQRVAERTAQLQATADISRATAGVRDLGELLELAVELIRGRFGYYHASVFLIDEAGEYAQLRESTGEIGAQLKARRHRLAIGSRSLVGWVTQNRRPRIARDVAGDPFHFKNPLLPETRSELCLPLIVGDRLIGALDVQSQEVDAFSETDVQALQVLADQLSIAIENAQLFQATQSDLAQARARYQQTLDANWRDVLGGAARELVYDLEPGGAVSAAPLLVPLRLRDQVIGTIELHRGPDATPLSPEEEALLDTVAAQLATALESAVLVQESQARSRRDRLITAITDEMRASLSPTAILQNSIRQLGRVLGATEVKVRLGAPPQPGGPAA